MGRTMVRSPIPNEKVQRRFEPLEGQSAAPSANSRNGASPSASLVVASTSRTTRRGQQNGFFPISTTSPMGHQGSVPMGHQSPVRTLSPIGHQEPSNGAQRAPATEP